MRIAVLLLFFLLALSAHSQQSRFSTSTECWTAEGDGTPPVFNNTGGRPGGFIQVTDQGTGGTWYFSAPTTFLGNKLPSFQRRLSFDWQTDHPNSSYDGKDVIIESGPTQMYIKVTPVPAVSWTSASVLLDTMGWKLSPGGTPVTRPQFKAILSNITKLLIRGEFSNKIDVGGLDNVVLEPFDSIGFAAGAACHDSCFSFLDYSGINATSWQWQFTAAQPVTAFQANPTPVCFPNPGTFMVILIASNACVADTLMTAVTVTAQNARYDTVTVCQNTSYTRPSGIVATAPGHYIDTLRSVQGCDSTVVHTTLQWSPAIRDSVVVTNATCYDKADGAVLFLSSGASPFTYQVAGNALMGNSLQQLLGGSYTYLVTDSFGCQQSGSFVVGRPAPLVVKVLPADTLVESGATVVLRALCSYDSVPLFWQPAAAVSCSPCDTVLVTVTDNTLLEVSATANPAGKACTARAKARVRVQPDLLLPTAFSPNGDGRNDGFHLSGKNISGVKQFSVAIYNRWGQLVFQSQDVHFNWLAENQDMGVYAYYIRYYDTAPREISGNVTVLR